MTVENPNQLPSSERVTWNSSPVGDPIHMLGAGLFVLFATAVLGAKATADLYNKLRANHQKDT